jgi:hypothetical protein
VLRGHFNKDTGPAAIPYELRVIAFAGTIPASGLANAVVTQWLAKSAYEAILTPATYMIVRFLKRREGLDVSQCNPFLIELGLNEQNLAYKQTRREWRGRPALSAGIYHRRRASRMQTMNPRFFPTHASLALYLFPSPIRISP